MSPDFVQLMTAQSEAAVSDPERRAALALHGLTVADRDWMLARLTVPRREKLLALLDELRELGIPPSAELASMLWQAPLGLPGLNEAQARCLLSGEPPQLVADLLAARDWVWRDGAVDLADGRKAAQPAPARLQAMLRAAEARATELLPSIPTTSVPRGQAQNHRGPVGWVRRILGELR